MRFSSQFLFLALIHLTHFPRFFSYGQFTRIACLPSVSLRAGSLDITLTAAGENGKEFRDLAFFSVELESDTLRQELSVMVQGATIARRCPSL